MITQKNNGYKWDCSDCLAIFKNFISYRQHRRLSKAKRLKNCIPKARRLLETKQRIKALKEVR